MIYEELVTGVLGYAGTIPIGRASPIPGSLRWCVEIYHKIPALKVPSRRQAREILAVHGADRVEVIYQVATLWPAGLLPPWKRYLTPQTGFEGPGRTLQDHLTLSKPTGSKINFPALNAFNRRWEAALPR